jgi:hypothetical protein
MNDLVLNEECILIGILFKQMILKPSIVKQLATEVYRTSSYDYRNVVVIDSFVECLQFTTGTYTLH